MFGVEVGGGGAGGGAVLAAPHRRRDRDGGGQQPPGRGAAQSRPGPSGLHRPSPSLLGGHPGELVLLVVAVHLEYHRLGLDVLDEGSGDGRRDVLHVVEVQRRSFAIILQWLRGERFIMAVDKTNEYILLKKY